LTKGEDMKFLSVFLAALLASVALQAADVQIIIIKNGQCIVRNMSTSDAISCRPSRYRESEPEEAVRPVIVRRPIYRDPEPAYCERPYRYVEPRPVIVRRVVIRRPMAEIYRRPYRHDYLPRRPLVIRDYERDRYDRDYWRNYRYDRHDRNRYDRRDRGERFRIGLIKDDNFVGFGLRRRF